MKGKIFLGLAAAISLAMILSSCFIINPNIPAVDLDFSVYLTDKPLNISNIDAVNVTLSDISVHATFNGQEDWYSVLSTPTAYNLVDLVGTAVYVAKASLPASALITQIRLVVASATLIEGTETHVLFVPSGNIKLNVAPVTISQSSAAYLDFDLSRSLKVQGNGQYVLSPVIHVVSGYDKGTLKGTVVSGGTPVVHALVTLSDASTDVASTYTQPDGDFTFVAVNSGNYSLGVDTDNDGLSEYSTDVAISKGANFIGTLNVAP